MGQRKRRNQFMTNIFLEFSGKRLVKLLKLQLKSDGFKRKLCSQIVNRDQQVENGHS